MLAGELYNASDPELEADRLRCRELCHALNQSDPADAGARRRILHQLFRAPADAWIEPPFRCDYGYNIELGERVYFNFNCVILDVMKVAIGDRLLAGPGVHIYTATHPIDAAARRAGLEYAKPVSIGTDVWIGGGAILCPGIRVGDRAVIAAGSVVTASVPDDVVVAGNPARIIRKIEENPPTDS